MGNNLRSFIRVYQKKPSLSLHEFLQGFFAHVRLHKRRIQWPTSLWTFPSSLNTEININNIFENGFLNIFAINNVTCSDEWIAWKQWSMNSDLLLFYWLYSDKLNNLNRELICDCRRWQKNYAYLWLLVSLKSAIESKLQSH